jgi:membrane fusion protein YbhG
LWIAAGTVLIVAALAWWTLQQSDLEPRANSLIASGTVEADEVLVSSEVIGRIVVLPANEGATVREGDVLARLDSSLIEMQIRQADVAARQQLEIQADKYVLRSPISGVVTRVATKVGEIIAPGETAVAVADATHLKLTLYVLERDVGGVHVGERVNVTADPFPGVIFTGTVTSVNTKAEYTPRNIQTQQDRLNLVFGVNVRVTSSGGLLKPGMPVDGAFVPTMP